MTWDIAIKHGQEILNRSVYEKMSVKQLRKRLEKRGLGVGGSKEELVNRLVEDD